MNATEFKDLFEKTFAHLPEADIETMRQTIRAEWKERKEYWIEYVKLTAWGAAHGINERIRARIKSDNELKSVEGA